MEPCTSAFSLAGRMVIETGWWLLPCYVPTVTSHDAVPFRSAIYRSLIPLFSFAKFEVFAVFIFHEYPSSHFITRFPLLLPFRSQRLLLAFRSLMNSAIPQDMFSVAKRDAEFSFPLELCDKQTLVIVAPWSFTFHW